MLGVLFKTLCERGQRPALLRRSHYPGRSADPHTQSLAIGPRVSALPRSTPTRVPRFWFLLAAAMILGGCSSGGGDSSSGGGGGGGAAPSPTTLTGVYEGTVQVTATSPAGGGTSTQPFSVYVTPDGVVQGVVPSDFGSLDCTTPSTDPVLSGNTFPLNLQATCNVPNVGQCSATISGMGTIEGTAMTGSGTLRLDCGVAGIATANFTFNANRTTAAPAGAAGVTVLGGRRGSVVESIVSGSLGGLR
jgi:hypothetical protein